MIQCGFGQLEITPELGCWKIGALDEFRGESVADPLFVRAAMFENESARLGLISLDVLSVRWNVVRQIREGIQQRFGFPGCNVMVCATHNHGGPAVCHLGSIPRDETYLSLLIEQSVSAFGMALESAAPAELGWERVTESELTGNRRLLLPDGSVRTHATTAEYPEALGPEGPMDPHVTVLAARNHAGQLLGAVVHFTCHVTANCCDTIISADFPGAMARSLASRGVPVALFLNGAAGNVHAQDVTGLRPVLTPNEFGTRLADDALQAIAGMTYQSNLPLACTSKTVQLPCRETTPEMIEGTSPGTQRFGAAGVYALRMPNLLRKIGSGTRPCEVQVLNIGHLCMVAVPGELFVEYGLQLATAARPATAIIVGYANGMLGYLVTEAAMRHGGYETTFGEPCFMAAEAGEMICETGLALIHALERDTQPIQSGGN